MEITEKTIADEKIAIINYKGPITDLDILVSKSIWAKAATCLEPGQVWKEAAIRTSSERSGLFGIFL